ncbi:hypothetical protein AK812_SmicGene15954 [Symbiodinium microadriaticum]|uniref:SP-RING-type domain-containing protein n=1 Tax=Symbiodinium microadriaticum TaxID=2951 RepID=A0A1Q9E1L8_SYMMI|nr:hypothetical protein AK812_SmicGene15954 [Symbiodinium microadriaticum]
MPVHRHQRLCSSELSTALDPKHLEALPIVSIVVTPKRNYNGDYRPLHQVVAQFGRHNRPELQVGPLTHERIHTPVRGERCAHLQCFDLKVGGAEGSAMAGRKLRSTATIIVFSYFQLTEDENTAAYIEINKNMAAFNKRWSQLYN